MSTDLKTKIVSDLQKAKGHLQYSFNKVEKYDLSLELDEAQLEALESFASRFSRFSDLVVAKYFRILAIEKDPAFRGSVIDLLNNAEKFGWITSALDWKRIRELRNLAAHEYSAEDYIELYRELVKLTPILFAISLDL